MSRAPSKCLKQWINWKIEKKKFHPHENQAQIMGWHRWDSTFMVFSTKMHWANTYAHHCTSTYLLTILISLYIERSVQSKKEVYVFLNLTAVIVKLTFVGRQNSLFLERPFFRSFNFATSLKLQSWKF